MNWNIGISCQFYLVKSYRCLWILWNQTRKGSEVFLVVLAVGKIHSSHFVKDWKEILSCYYGKGSFRNILCDPKYSVCLKTVFKEWMSVALNWNCAGQWVMKPVGSDWESREWRFVLSSVFLGFTPEKKVLVVWSSCKQNATSYESFG